MARAWWNGVLIADSDDTIVDDGFHYFPPDAVRRDLLQPSETRTISSRGEAVFWHLMVGGELNADAAWSYPDPAPDARELAGRIAFWHGVEIEES